MLTVQGLMFKVHYSTLVCLLRRLRLRLLSIGVMVASISIVYLEYFLLSQPEFTGEIYSMQVRHWFTTSLLPLILSYPYFLTNSSEHISFYIISASSFRYMFSSMISIISYGLSSHQSCTQLAEQLHFSSSGNYESYGFKQACSCYFCLGTQLVCADSSSGVCAGGWTFSGLVFSGFLSIAGWLAFLAGGVIAFVCDFAFLLCSFWGDNFRKNMPLRLSFSSALIFCSSVLTLCSS